jgi:hypothetical protein
MQEMKRERCRDKTSESKRNYSQLWQLFCGRSGGRIKIWAVREMSATPRKPDLHL